MKNSTRSRVRVFNKIFPLAFLLLLSFGAFAQSVIKGVVRDNNNKPVENASVIVKGTSVGTVSGADGSFTITVPKGSSSLLISSLNFDTKEIDVSDGKNVAVNLAGANTSLNEVVVTGYSTQRKKDITGAVSVVNVADLKTQPGTDAAASLQGRASGVTVTQNGVPGAASTVRIRGLGSFTNNNPLYVIDGVQTGSMSEINPNDIESLQVLKDAGAASIYGVRGSNGVIVITTKKGRKKGVSVAYDMYYGTQAPGKGLDLLNAQESAELYFLQRKNAGVATTGSVYGNGSTPVLPDFIHYTGYVANGTPINSGNPAVDQSNYSLDNSKLFEPGYTPYIIVPANKNGTDWYDEITSNAPIQNHNLSMNGAGENSRYLLSLNYFNQQAITEYQFYKRYTARLNSEFNVKKNVRIGQNLQIFSSSANTPGAGDQNQNTEASAISQTFRLMSIVPVYTSNGIDFAGNKGGPGVGTWGNSKNPLAQLYRNRNNRNNNLNLFGNLYAEVDFLKHFTARTSFGGRFNDNNSYSYPYAEYENNENTTVNTYTENFIRTHNWIWTNQLNYKNVFGDHSINAIVGTEAQEGGGRQTIGASTGFFNYTNINFINLGNGAVQNLGGSQTFTPVRTQSYFAKLDYAFQGKYLLSATIRRDGSSKFVGDNRWGNFPAFSLGWRVSEEGFMRNISWLNDLKVRGSWGKLGNEAAVSAVNAVTTFGSVRGSSWYDINGNQTQPTEGFYQTLVGNTGTTWEANVTTNIGFDATLFNGTTDITFDWYQRKTEGLLYPPSVQAIQGSSPQGTANLSSMKNTGIDLMISHRTNITRDLHLNLTGTFTTYKNEITNIVGDLGFFDYNSPINEANRIGSNATRNFVGNSFNTYYGYNVIGLFQSAGDVTKSPKQTDAAPGRFKYEDVNGDGEITPDDRKIIGNPNPKLSYGLNIGLDYKGFDFLAFFYGVSGNDAFNFTKWWTDFSPGTFPGGRSKASLYDSWLPDGSRPNAKTPIQELTNGTGFSTDKVVNSYYVEDASYFRLRNLQIGYTLPVALTTKANISKVRIYIQGTNLFTITKYSGFNPDITSTDDRSAAIDIGAYPTVKQFLFGLNVTF